MPDCRYNWFEMLNKGDRVDVIQIDFSKAFNVLLHFATYQTPMVGVCPQMVNGCVGFSPISIKSWALMALALYQLTSLVASFQVMWWVLYYSCYT